ncbi:hypothetical protein KWH77_23745, partial [Enterobacter sichuanensis]|uniref:hypothetical protein n=1 Tax=Enterobacter sichuanensis TaxID=2071710 RepID=UPI0021D1ACE2
MKQTIGRNAQTQDVPIRNKAQRIHQMKMTEIAPQQPLALFVPLKPQMQKNMFFPIGKQMKQTIGRN